MMAYTVVGMCVCVCYTSVCDTAPHLISILTACPAPATPYSRPSP